MTKVPPKPKKITKIPLEPKKLQKKKKKKKPQSLKMIEIPSKHETFLGILAFFRDFESILVV